MVHARVFVAARGAGDAPMTPTTGDDDADVTGVNIVDVWGGHSGAFRPCVVRGNWNELRRVCFTCAWRRPMPSRRARACAASTDGREGVTHCTDASGGPFVNPNNYGCLDCDGFEFKLTVATSSFVTSPRRRAAHGDAATIAEVGIESHVTTAVDAAVEPTTDARDAGERRPRCRRSTRERGRARGCADG